MKEMRLFQPPLASTADILFTQLPTNLSETPELIQSVQRAAAQYGRSTDVYTQTQVVCRSIRKEGEDFYHYFAHEQADEEVLAYFQGKKLKTIGKNVSQYPHRARSPPQLRGSRIGVSSQECFPLWEVLMMSSKS